MSEPRSAPDPSTSLGTGGAARLVTALSDRYRIERELGAGGMATVYLAEDLKHDRKVAIKVLRPELAAVIGAERFLAEIKTTANLQHPHILSLFDSGTVDGTVFYVMPFVDGESLRDRLAREKQLPIADAVRIARETADALQYAHQHGVIHRNIKPENILLQGGHALVADFGIALAAAKTGGTRMTETGMSLGTPQYMSPEQAMGERDLDARTDVYALGVVTYEMLVGEPPFTGPTAQAIVAKVMTADPVEAATLRKSVPANVSRAISVALQKLSADRFGSAAEFAAALSDERGAGATTLSASPRQARRPLAMVVIGAAACAVALLGGRRWGESSSTTPSYQGERLGGSLIAMAARVSPDGQSVAFSAMVDGKTQVGLLKPGSGDWTILTHDSTGIIGEFAWAPDGTRIYFSHFNEVPRGVYSITPLGGDERLVLESAATPEPLPDGSLLVSRLSTRRLLQMYRFWPESGRLDTLDATSPLSTGVAFFHVLPTGGTAVFFGFTRADSAKRHLYELDLATGKSRRLAPDVDLSALTLAVEGFGLTRDGASVLVDLPVQDFHRIFAIPRHGSAAPQLLFTYTGTFTNNIDGGPDGSIYLDAGQRPIAMAVYTPATRAVTMTKMPDTYLNVLPLDHDRMLAVDRVLGRRRTLLITPGKDPVPLVASAEEITAPLARLGTDRVVLTTIASGRVAMAVASTVTGRLLTRFPDINPENVAGSSDGNTIYFLRAGRIWSVPAVGGTARAIRDGDGVAVDPHGKYLVVQLNESSAVRLIKMPLDGGNETPIAINSALPLSSLPIAAGAIGPDGRIAVRLAPPAAWFWPAGILDPATGRIEPIPTEKELDVADPQWDANGRIVSLTEALSATLWRYRPVRAKGGTQ